MWNGKHHGRVHLKDLGLVIQLGHPPGRRCPSPALAPAGFVVIDTNGMHAVNLQFCECDKIHKNGTRLQQLMRYKLFPATLDRTTTCGTFRLLEQFHLLTLQSKINVYDFYLSLQKMSDNTGLSKQHVCILSDVFVYLYSSVLGTTSAPPTYGA